MNCEVWFIILANTHSITNAITDRGKELIIASSISCMSEICKLYISKLYLCCVYLFCSSGNVPGWSRYLTTSEGFIDKAPSSAKGAGVWMALYSSSGFLWVLRLLYSPLRFHYSLWTCCELACVCYMFSEGQSLLTSGLLYFCSHHLQTIWSKGVIFSFIKW